MSSDWKGELARFDPELPLERASTIPSAWYFDGAIYEMECRAIFGLSWQMAGRIEQTAAPGQFLTADIAGEPILVVRDESGALNGFHNVCRHRAAPLLNEPCGRVTKLRCRYHGWTYDLGGRLRGTPEFDGVVDFDKQENSLKPVHVDEWGPFVWVHLGEPRQTLLEYLRPLPEWAAGQPGFGELKYGGSHAYELNCNWKVYVDNFLDGGYHVNTVHPRLAGVLDYSQYRTATHGRTSVQTAPLVASATDHVASRTRAGARVAYWWAMPNFMLNVYENTMDSNLVLPLGPGRCRVVFDFYFQATEGSEAEQFMAESMAVANEVQVEDMKICEEVQKGLASRSFQTGRFSVKREGAGYFFHQLLARQLQAAL